MTTKKFIFIFFPLIIFFLIFEFIFYTYFKIEDFQDLENYINKRKELIVTNILKILT